MTLGALASPFVALGLSYEPVKRVSRGNLELQAALGAFERVADVLDEPIEPARGRPAAARGHGRRGGIPPRPLRHEARPVLIDVSLHRAGWRDDRARRLSGAGKSTLMDCSPVSPSRRRARS
jgi:ABC-type multidrug transport system fused ATPase/permease subunit